jgi:phosphonate transport system substrate-binding protein
MGMEKIKYLLFLMLFFGFNVLALPAKNITIGTISINPMEVIKIMTPLAKYIALNLDDKNISDGKVLIARDTETMARYMNEGKVDIFIESEFPALLVNIATGNKIVLRRWKGGVREYRSVIIAKKDIKTLDQLKGGTITFDHPYSTSGYFVPKTMLLNKGFNVIPFKKNDQPGRASAISYIFSNADENSYYMVLKGAVKAGVMDEPSYLQFVKEYHDSLNVLYRSSAIPRQVVIFNKKLSEKIKHKLTSLLMDMDRDAAGSTILRNYQNTTKFDLLSNDDADKLFKYRIRVHDMKQSL